MLAHCCKPQSCESPLMLASRAFGKNVAYKNMRTFRQGSTDLTSRAESVNELYVNTSMFRVSSTIKKKKKKRNMKLHFYVFCFLFCTLLTTIILHCNTKCMSDDRTIENAKPSTHESLWFRNEESFGNNLHIWMPNEMNYA